ncbi:DUF3696 domain-containing protein [Nocardia panacis]|uniref:DUF3696 domain-containing protein n=1 Tax=Nocardia panacis TaxID=2340916 RepID=A0A3A4KAC2_9NOCA|nr:DUF3696 domain-containing protein [Nocardia panacis]RJO69086.1 DUF3696 domain-containing protein [Nocardia panacis]
MLTGVELVNFKAFAQQEMPLRPLTLLTGLNSSGKSTVLHALALLRQSADAGTLPAGRKPLGHHGFTLNGDLVSLGTGRDVRHEAWVKFSDADPGGIGIGLIGASGASWQWSVDYVADDDLLSLSSDNPLQDRHRPNLFDPGFQYLRSDRINPAVSYPRSAAGRRGFLGVHGEHAVNILRLRQDDSVPASVRHPDAVSASLLRQSEAWLGTLCPGINLSATDITGTDSVRLGYRFGTGGLSSSNPYRPTNVGFGLTYALPIVIACLTAVPGSLILLENPEAHLHPRGQSAMAELIARTCAAGAQVLVETHSDHVLNGLRIAVKNGILPHDQVCPLYFRRDDDHVHRVEVLDLGPKGTISHWPEGFFDEWDRALDELID